MGLLGMFIFIGGILRPFRACTRGGHGYHYHGNTVYSLFTGCTIAALGFVAMSSAVLAGMRRATGLTIRHMHRMPPVDVRKTELWLQWYDAKLARINEKAQEKIAHTVSRYAPEIYDPAVRAVWEAQLRTDVNEKVNRLRERRKHYSDLLVSAKKPKEDASFLTHPPLLAGYLFVGEWIFDHILAWARNNPHFYYEPTGNVDVPGSVSYDDLLDSPIDDPPAAHNPFAHGALLDSPAQALVRSSNIGPAANAAYPAPYIAAVNQPLTLNDKQPEPSAPSLTESQFLQLIESIPNVPAQSIPPVASTSRHPPMLQPEADPRSAATDFDPPPYTPVIQDDDIPTSPDALESPPAHKLVPDDID
ncbi:hypothetical protein LPJ81_001840 [Coemansia sp. IMI 209127]|nr:hypothetical protein LPJ81_001840 [Coemansia sp. IMI 209127]